MIKTIAILTLAVISNTGLGETAKPNIIVYYADDISARELPVYGSSVWSDPFRQNTSDSACRARTPVLDRLAEKGCWIKTAWAACVCNPSRAMMMTGRYAHIHKWWNNKDKGAGYDENGKLSTTWPVYQSSPIFCADNGTSGYGKNSGDQQKGCHIPMIIYAPGMTKQGRQDVLVSVADMMPTIADLVGFKLPPEYEVNGESLVPFLYTDQKEHRQWIYCHRGPEQLIRTRNVLKDGRDKWWDVIEDPADLTGYTQIKNWTNVSQVQRRDRDMLLKVLPQYDLYFDEYNQPCVPDQPNARKPKYFRKKKGT